MNIKQLVLSNTIIAAILSVTIFTMFASTTPVEQAFAQDTNTSTASDKGTPFAIQDTVQSQPDELAPGHEQYHQIAVVLPERQDDKMFVGTITFTATQPLQVIVQHPFDDEVSSTNATAGVPLGASEGESAVTLLHNEEGQFFGNNVFAGSGLYLHSRSSQPFVASYTVAGMLVDPAPLPQQ